MEKVAGFINANHYREALARLCSLAQLPTEDGRRVLDDWEKKHSRNPSAIRKLQHSIDDETISVTNQDLESDPLLWLQVIDEHCHLIFGPDNTFPHDKIEDGEGKSSVFPIYPGSGKGKKREQFGNITFWLKHHRVVPLDNPQGIPVAVSEIPPGYKDWATNNLSGETVKIGIVHFSDNVKLDISYTDNSFFICNGISDDKIRLDAALEYIKAAKADGVHLLVMPELTITSPLRSLIVDNLLRLNEQSGDEHELSVPIIILGSFHEKFDNKWRNHAEAVLGLDGTTLFSCDKRKRATVKDCAEGIECSPTPMTCLYSPLGLTGMAICKDLFDGEPAAVLHTLSLDWLLVPSMSDKLGPHMAAAKNLRDTGGTVVAVANQEIPDTTDYDPGFIHHVVNKKCTKELTIEHVARSVSHLRIVK